MPDVKVRLSDETLRSILIRTKAQNVAEAIKEAVEAYLNGLPLDEERIQKLVEDSLQRELTEMLEGYKKQIEKSVSAKLQAVIRKVEEIHEKLVNDAIKKFDEDYLPIVEGRLEGQIRALVPSLVEDSLKEHLKEQQQIPDRKTVIVVTDNLKKILEELQ